MWIDRSLTVAKSMGWLKANSIGLFASQVPKSGTEMLRTTSAMESELEPELEPCSQAVRANRQPARARPPERVGVVLMLLLGRGDPGGAAKGGPPAVKTSAIGRGSARCPGSIPERQAQEIEGERFVGIEAVPRGVQVELDLEAHEVEQARSERAE